MLTKGLLAAQLCAAALDLQEELGRESGGPGGLRAGPAPPKAGPKLARG